MRSLGRSPDANTALDIARSAAGDSFDKRIVELCSNAGAKPAPDDTLLARYYWGVAALVRQERETAMDVFHQIVSSRFVEYPEFDLATYHLGQHSD
jgi:hypothetical protein